MEKPQIVTYSQGLAAYPNLIPVGFFLLVAGIMFTWQESVLIGLSFFAILGVMFTARDGISFRLDNQTYHSFVNIMGIKIGKWKSYQAYPDVVMLSMKSKQTVGGEYGVALAAAITTSKSRTFDIYLYTARHTRRIWVKDFHDRDKADAFIHEISQTLGLEIARYQPGKPA